MQFPRQITREEAARLGTSAWMVRGEDFIHYYTYAKGF